MRNKTLTLTSPVFENMGEIPKKYTCDGENYLPPLEISGVPKGTQSLILILDDPDAEIGIEDHLVMWNISPERKKIVENILPKEATVGKNSIGIHGYGSPCPSKGAHRYFFKLFAIDAKIDENDELTKQEILALIEDHIIDHSELVGTYRRK